MKCAENHLSTDLTLGLAFLLAIPDPTEADKCFRSLPHIPLVLRLGSYYYALQLLTSLSQPLHGSVSQVISLAQDVSKDKLSNSNVKVSISKVKGNMETDKSPLATLGLV